MGALFGGQPELQYRKERGGRALDWAWFGAFIVYPGCVAVGGGGGGGMAVKAITLSISKLQKKNYRIRLLKYRTVQYLLCHTSFTLPVKYKLETGINILKF